MDSLKAAKRTILVGLVCLLSFPLPSSAAELTKINLAYIGVTASNWPGLVAQDKGFFKDEGLDIAWIVSGQSSKSAQQVMAGVAQIGNSTVPDTFRAIDAGGDLIVFVNALASGVHQLVGAKSIKNVEELKGRRVIVGGQKDITGLWWYAMASHFGFDGAKDVQLLISGSTSNRYAALVSGGVEAAVLSPPSSFRAIEGGFTDLGPVAPFLGEFPMSIYHVNKTWAANNKSKVVAFVRAHNRAVKYMLDPAHKEEVSRILAKASNSSLEDALRTYDVVVKVHGYVPDGRLRNDAIERVLKILAEEGDIKTPVKSKSAFYDPQYTDAAER